MSNSGEEIVKVLYIYFPICFLKNQVKTLFNSGSEINGMTPGYAKKLGFTIWKTNLGTQKIDGSALKIFGMVTANFQVKNKAGQLRFF